MNSVTQEYVAVIKELRAELARWQECADRLAVAISSEAIARDMHPDSPEVQVRKFRSAEAVDLYLSLANERAGKRA